MDALPKHTHENIDHACCASHKKSEPVRQRLPGAIDELAPDDLHVGTNGALHVDRTRQHRFCKARSKKQLPSSFHTCGHRQLAHFA
jgi:hypothetical protein